MFWLSVLGVVVVVSLVLHRLARGRRSPVVDESELTNANYARINQELQSFDRRFGHPGG